MIALSNDERPTADTLIEKLKTMKRSKPKNFEFFDELPINDY